MKPQITELQKWVQIDGTEGVVNVPIELLPQFEHMSNPELSTVNPGLDQYYNGEIWEVDIVEGHGARLSMPGYMDCTEWSVYDSVEEARKGLEETYDIDVRF